MEETRKASGRRKEERETRTKEKREELKEEDDVD